MIDCSTFEVEYAVSYVNLSLSQSKLTFYASSLNFIRFKGLSNVLNLFNKTVGC